MANSVLHAALPYPIKNARFTLAIPYLDADGDPTDPTTPDTEFSLDAAAFADCAEEVTTITGSNGSGYLTLTGAETNGSLLQVAAKVASGPKATLATLYPRVLPIVGSGTLSAGSAGGGTLGTILAYDITGCFIRTTGGTGGGGTGGANNQARKIITYTTSTGAFTVAPNWETTPDATTTYEVLLPEGMTLGSLKTLNPTTSGRTLDVSTGGEAGVDWANVGSPTTTVGLTNTTVGIVTTLTGHTPQTGDSYAIVNSGTHGNAAIKGFVDDIGTAGAGLTAVPWNAAWDAEVQSEVDDALVAQRLDELLNADSDIDGAAPPTVGSVFHELLSKTAGSFTFDQTTDSLEALRDRGDAAWLTATGFSTLTQADIRTSVGLASANLDTQLSDIDNFLDTEIAAILADTNELQVDWVNGGRLDLLIDAIKARTDLIPTVIAGTVAASPTPTATTFKTSLSSSTYTADCFNDQIIRFLSGTLIGQTKPILDTTLDGGFVVIEVDEAFTTAPTASDSFEIIPDHVHPITQIQSGLSTLTQSDIRTAIGLAAANLDTQLAAIANYIDTEIATILAAVDTEVAAIKTKTDNLPTDPADESSIQAAIAGLNNVSTAQITAAILAMVIEGSETFQQAMRIIRAAAAGKLSGAATTTVAIRDAADTKARITATVDADGNRTAVTVDGT